MHNLTIDCIDGAYLILPDVHTDERGFFCETSSTMIADAPFIRFCFTRSARGVLRGLHVRPAPGEAKLVRCCSGEIYDVIVDLRRDSLTYRNWQGFQLSGDDQVSLRIPAGCAHGYQALTDTADVTYHIEAPYVPGADLAIAWNDPELDIPWPLRAPILSDRDRDAPLLADVVKLL